MACSELAGYMRWVHKCNNGGAQKHRHHPWTIGTSTVGYLQPWLFQRLSASFPDIFQVVHSPSGALDSLMLAPQLDDCQKRTNALSGVMSQLRDDGSLSGWRGEMYPVVTGFHAEPLALVERAAAVYFGIKAYGVHINGFTDTQHGEEMWVATRSLKKPTWPGKLDHMVAGGQPHGLSPAANVVKECWEEAGVPAELAARAVPAGAVSYEALVPEGIKRDVLFCYDLQLPEGFVPEPQDGEVESFERLPMDSVADIIAHTDSFKDNCNLVIIDFLLRHGHVRPEQKGYLELLAGMRADLLTCSYSNSPVDEASTPPSDFNTTI